MNIHEMHNTFRTIGQQMGLQLIRGILPESIDIFLNETISELTQQILNVGIRTALQDTVETQSQMTSPINVFRTLYRSARFLIDVNDQGSGKVVDYWNQNNGYHIINIPTIYTKDSLQIQSDEYYINPMMFLGFSVEYPETERGQAIACRLIGSDVLETTLRDYCNSASRLSPIVCLSSAPNLIEGAQLESMRSISTELLEIYTGTQDCAVNHLLIKYIKTPNRVMWHTDINQSVSCDLPEHVHYIIVEAAVQKFYQSISVGQQPQSGAQQQPRSRQRQTQQQPD